MLLRRIEALKASEPTSKPLFRHLARFEELDVLFVRFEVYVFITECESTGDDGASQTLATVDFYLTPVDQ